MTRRQERLEKRLRETELLQRETVAESLSRSCENLNEDDLEDLEDAPDSEIAAVEEEVLDQATAARSIEELKAEIATLGRLSSLAATVRRSGEDRKWRELAALLAEVFLPSFGSPTGGDGKLPVGNPDPPSPRKLVVFTEHRDTLNYLTQRIRTVLGREEAVVTIHGSVGRDDRTKIQEEFRSNPDVRVLVATDAAGEGINLQRANLMVNYDLPWNPNRLEQRFGRIHRIGQTEVCHLWNLVAPETREGHVYHRLLEKLDEARKAFGGQIFDVLGKLQFEGKPLRDLLIEAVRYGEQPEVKARQAEALENAFNRREIEELLEDHALAHDSMDASRVRRVREDMERADARRLQPHYIESFFLEAFRVLGGTVRQREPKRWEVTHVPAPVRGRNVRVGPREPVLARYERIAFEKDLVAPLGQPLAAFVCPGHPLLDTTLDLTLDRNRDLLQRGTVLVSERDAGETPRVFFYLAHSIQDASKTRNGDRTIISQRMLYVEIDSAGEARHVAYAPYLDFRPLRAEEPPVAAILSRPECTWITKDLERVAQNHAIASVVPEHLAEVRGPRLQWIDKARAAVKDRLTKEINHWDNKAQQLQAEEREGKVNARLNSQEARRRADDLQARLAKRLEHLALEGQISALPPVVLGGFVVIPAGLLTRMTGVPAARAAAFDTQVSAARARAAVLEVERSLGYEAVDRELERLGYDIESRDPKTGRLRFIEVKGRAAGAETITVTKNEILYSLNKPEDFILAMVELHEDGSHTVHYLRQPFRREPDFHAASVNYDFGELLARAEAPR